ncbi:polyprenyl synthetase family protein [Pelotomaculum propionicicum]|uniref:polyprenyl synthetase family protein n=1 Tax=Pelotomaculum propionicicum TaxID=258475 RepID=UPI001863D097|nr:polyprenyl synthetase family protein [Pelotomaculum propionicicum]
MWLDLTYKPIRKELADLEKEIAGVCEIPDLRPFPKGGKRLRPALVLLSSCFGKGPCGKVTRLAAAVETLHQATLLHDDIIDQAQSRRGEDTFNKVFGESTALLVGDYLYATFLERSSGLGQTALQNLAAVLKDMIQAEFAQQKDLFNCAIDEKSYLRRTLKKSGSFLACCCKLGALLAGAPAKTVFALEKFGLHAGISFQITDDLLDFKGNSNTLGKPVGQDITQGLLTLPVIHVLANSPANSTIRGLIEKRDLHPASIEYIVDAMRDAGSLSYTAVVAERYTCLAGRVLATLPGGAARDSLNALLEFIKTREC